MLSKTGGWGGDDGLDILSRVFAVERCVDELLKLHSLVPAEPLLRVRVSELHGRHHCNLDAP
jgi:hypothetical protein